MEYGYVNDKGQFVIINKLPFTRPADEYQAVGYSSRWQSRQDWQDEGQELARQVRQEIKRYGS